MSIPNIVLLLALTFKCKYQLSFPKHVDHTSIALFLLLTHNLTKVCVHVFRSILYMPKTTLITIDVRASHEMLALVHEIWRFSFELITINSTNKYLYLPFLQKVMHHKAARSTNCKLYIFPENIY